MMPRYMYVDLILVLVSVLAKTRYLAITTIPTKFVFSRHLVPRLIII